MILAKHGKRPVGQNPAGFFDARKGEVLKYKRIPHRMEVWFADLGKHPGSCVQEGIRPVVVISNDVANEHAETVTVLPMTSRIKKVWLPSHIHLTEEEMKISRGYHDHFDPSLILLEQITTIDRNAFRTYVGFIMNPSKRSEIGRAVVAQLEAEVSNAN